MGTISHVLLGGFGGVSGDGRGRDCRMGFGERVGGGDGDVAGGFFDRVGLCEMGGGEVFMM